MRVFITGSGGGLGRAMAVECAKRGYDLFLTDIHTSCLEAIKCGIMRRYDVDIVIHACDLTNADDLERMMRDIDAQGLSFDMMLGIAGVDYEGGFLEREIGKIRTILRLNIEATLSVTHAVLRRRTPGQRFHLVFVSSLASMYPIPLKATYAASKRFLLDFSIALGQELRNEDVRVLSLCPGGLATTQKAMNGIAAQGMWGQATTNRLETVAHRTISRVLRGRRTYYPGVVNRVFSILGQMLPRTLIAKLLYNRWHTAQKKWLAT